MTVESWVYVYLALAATAAKGSANPPARTREGMDRETVGYMHKNDPREPAKQTETDRMS